MNIRLYNAKILTMEKHKDVFEGEIWIKNEKIAYLGETKKLQAQITGDFPMIHWDLELDCGGNLLMPGFKNAHTHSAMTFLRSYADDLPLAEWLNEKVFPLESKLTYEDIYQLTKLAILEYLSSGITSIFDMYLIPDAVAEACSNLGMRCVLTSGLNRMNSSIEQQEQEYLKWNKKSNPLISYLLGFHAEYTCSQEQIYRMSQLARKYRAPVYMHMAETRQEVEDCKKRTGLTPARYLDTMGIFEYGGGAFHCVHMTPEDCEVFRRRRLHVITNPSSNLKLASGIAPIAEFEKYKIPVAIGTDGPGSNNCLDMFREMFLVAGLSKVVSQDASAVGAERVLRMATVHGAKAMHLFRADVLAKGKLADLILIDLHQPNMQPSDNIISNLVYSANKSNVLMTMINGRILYRNGEYFVGESPTDIIDTCNQIIQKLHQA